MNDSKAEAASGRVAVSPRRGPAGDGAGPAGDGALRAAAALAWLAVVCTLALAGFRVSLSATTGRAPSVGGPFATAETWLEGFGADDTAARLAAELAGLPGGAPLAFVSDAADVYFEQRYYAVSYLAAPRPVWAIGCGPTGAVAKAGVPPPNVRFAGVILVGASRADWAAGEAAVADGLRVASPREGVEWSAFCPS